MPFLTKAFPAVLFAAAISLALAPCGISRAGEGDVALRILHVNDTHSHLEPLTLGLTLGGEPTYLEIGGFPGLKAAVEKLRADGRFPAERNLLLHAGDAVQGTLYFNRFDGRAEADFLNLMGFDAMAVGNHEFDRGPEFLAGFIKQVVFPMLAANIDAGGDPALKGAIKPFIVKDVGGASVGIIGAITPDTPLISNAGDNLRFPEVIDVLKKAVAALEDKGVTRIVLLSHCGYDLDREIAGQVAGLDVIVGGHSHTLLGEFKAIGLSPRGEYPTRATGPGGDPVLIVQAWEWTKVLGVLEVTFDGKGVVRAWAGSPVMVSGDGILRKNPEGKRVPVTDENREAILETMAASGRFMVVDGDPEGLALLNRYRPGLEELRRTKVASIADELSTTIDHSIHLPPGTVEPKCPLIAQLAAESFYWKLNRMNLNVDVVLSNAGNIRCDTFHGDLTVAMAFELLPFGNTTTILELTGAEIRQALEYGLARGEGAFPIIAGMRCSVDPSRPEGQRAAAVEIIERSGNWAPLDDTRMYKVGVNNFLANGGDGYLMLKDARGHRIDAGFLEADMLIEYASFLGELKKPDAFGIRFIK